MFGDPATNPKGWVQKFAGRLGTVTTGNTPPRDDPRNYGDVIEWIKSDNLNTSDYYATRASEGLSEAGMARARVVPAGAILVTCIAGSPGSIGNAAMVNRPVAFNQQINAFVPEVGNPHFYFAQLTVGKRLVQQASTGGMKGLVSKGRFERILLMEPPQDLQDRFSELACRIERIKSRVHASLGQMEALYLSLEHRAFRGEL
jgi:type I restriction enzyme S subunit